MKDILIAVFLFAWAFGLGFYIDKLIINHPKTTTIKATEKIDVKFEVKQDIHGFKDTTYIYIINHDDFYNVEILKDF